jgi:hypothetical protein
MKRTLVVALAVSVLAACATAPIEPPGSAGVVRAQGATTRLVLLDGDAAGRELTWSGYPQDTTGVDPASERAVRALCGADPEPVKAAAGVAELAGLFLRPVVALIVGTVDKAIQAELDAYVAAYSASTLTERFYAATDPEIVLGSTCFRFSRTDGAVTALDLVGQLRLAEDGGALMIRPLRLYFAEAKARGDVVGLAVSLKAEAVWLDSASRKTEKTFDVTVLKEARRTGAPSVTYYVAPEAPQGEAAFIPVKLPPWTRRTAHTGATGNVTLTLTVAEAGNTPSHLKTFAAIFSDKQDDLSKLIAKALEPVLGLQ